MRCRRKFVNRLALPADPVAPPFSVVYKLKVDLRP